MPRTLDQRYTLSYGSTRLVRVDLTEQLQAGASLSGTPTVAEITTSELTIASAAVNTASYTDKVTGSTVAVGKGVQFTVEGGDNAEYRVRITVSTNSSPAETIVRDVLLSFDSLGFSTGGNSILVDMAGVLGTPSGFVLSWG